MTTEILEKRLAEIKNAIAQTVAHLNGLKGQEMETNFWLNHVAAEKKTLEIVRKSESEVSGA